MAYQNIIFDWDGVLVQTPEIWIDSIATAGREFGLTFTPSQIRLQSADFSKAMEHGLPKELFKAYDERIHELADQRLGGAPLYAGAAEMLRELRNNGKKLAILSSGLNAREEIRRKHLEHFFEFIISGKDVTKRKPDPEGVLKALELLNAGKPDSVFVGDAWTDLKAAGTAGIPSVLYYPSGHSKIYDFEELMSNSPTYVVTNHAQLLKLLLTGPGNQK
jgi:HAD superfamily hydrolase (TIGR01549 family)